MSTREEYYRLALQITYRQDQTIQPWVEHARSLADQLFAGAPLDPNMQPPIGSMNLPSQGSSPVTPPGVSGSRFGAAFAGWDDVALMQILLTAQEIVLAREHGANEERHHQLQQQLQTSLSELERAHREAARARKP